MTNTQTIQKNIDPCQSCKLGMTAVTHRQRQRQTDRHTQTHTHELVYTYVGLYIKLNVYLLEEQSGGGLNTSINRALQVQVLLGDYGVLVRRSNQ